MILFKALIFFVGFRHNFLNLEPQTAFKQKYVFHESIFSESGGTFFILVANNRQRFTRATWILKFMVRTVISSHRDLKAVFMKNAIYPIKRTIVMWLNQFDVTEIERQFLLKR